MKTILFTSPFETENEIMFIAELFDLGLDYLYLNKPELDDFSLVDFIEQIPAPYWKQCFSTSLIITKEFDFAGYHFTADIIAKNKLYHYKIIDWLNQNNKISSVNANNFEELEQYTKHFKQIFIPNTITAPTNQPNSFVLLADNNIDLNSIQQHNYDGIDISNILWQEENSEDAIKKFVEIKQNHLN